MTPFKRSRRELLIGGTAAAVGAMLPACRSEPPASPPPGGAGFRRKNLSTDFTKEEQRELGDLVFGYLTRELIDGHMHQVDHLDNLFSDHRAYLYEMEKHLIRDGHLKYVPLPYWEPINDIPEGWERVHEPYQYMRLAPFNFVPRPLRPQMPQNLRPENIGASNFATAHDVALEIGRSAFSSVFPSGQLRYHFTSHAALGGPFVSMTTAASALIFWAFHGLLIDVYDKWLTSKFPGANARTVAGRHGDGHLELFTVTSHNQLWQSQQRLKTTHYNDLDQNLGLVDVTFPHWTHWSQLGSDKDISDVRVTTDQAGQLVLVAQVKGDGGASNELFVMRQVAAGWGPWIALTPQTAEIRDFAVSLNANNTLEIFVIRRTAGSEYVVSTKTETAPQGSAFGAWADIAGPGPFQRIATGRHRTSPYLVVSTSGGDPGAGPLVHVWRSNNAWAQRTLTTDPFTAVQIAVNQDGRPEIVAIRTADNYAYRKYLKTATGSIGSDESWSDWERIGSGSVTFRTLALGQHHDGRLAAVATDSSGKIHQISQVSPNGGWAGWEEIPRLASMGAVGNPLVARDYTNGLKVFVRGEDNFTYSAEQVAPNAGSWIGWMTI